MHGGSCENGSFKKILYCWKLKMCQQKYGNASCSVHHQVRWWWVDMQYIIKGAAAAFILSCILYLSLRRRLSSQTSESLCHWYELRQPFCAHTHILLFSKYHLRFSSATVIYSSKMKPEGLLQFCEWQWPIVMMLRLIQFRRSPYLRLDYVFFFFLLGFLPSAVLFSLQQSRYLQRTSS